MTGLILAYIPVVVGLVLIVLLLMGAVSLSFLMPSLDGSVRDQAADLDGQADVYQHLSPSQSDVDAVNELCLATRSVWEKRQLDRTGKTVWKEHCLAWDATPEAGYSDCKRWNETQGLETFWRAVDQAEPHPDPPVFEIQGPLAVIRCPSARYRIDGNWVNIENLMIAMRINGRWAIVASIPGNWLMDGSNRFRSANPEHLAVQKHFSTINQPLATGDVDRYNRLVHSSFMSIVSDISDPPNGVVGDREGVMEWFRASLAEHAWDRREQSVTHVKTIGPVAVVFTQVHEIAGGEESIKDGGLNVLCRTPEGWQAAIWVQGDWGNVIRSP